MESFLPHPPAFKSNEWFVWEWIEWFIKNDLKGELKTLKTILGIILGNHRSEISSIKSTL